MNSLLARVDAAGVLWTASSVLPGKSRVVTDGIPVQGQGLPSHPAYRRLEGIAASRTSPH